MKYFVAIMLIFGPSGKAISQKQMHLQNMSDTFVFSSVAHQESLSHFPAIYTAMGRYYEGVEKADIKLLQKVFHKTWTMRDTDTPDESYLNIEDKTTFIRRVSDHGPYVNYAVDRSLANYGMAYGKLAYIRINKDPSRNATGFFLYKLANGWAIMDKIFVSVQDVDIAAGDVQKNYAGIEQLLDKYFSACRLSEEQAINPLRHDGWDSKYIGEDGLIEVQTKSDFLKALPPKNHIENLAVSSIDLYHNKLAVVRLDYPALSSTSFITMFKIKGDWKIAFERMAKN